MHELTIPRRKLIRNLLWKGGCGCLTGHVLRAAGIAEHQLDDSTYSFAAECVPQSIAALVESVPVPESAPKRWTLTVETRNRVVHPFDDGREDFALRNFRDFGWNVTIQENV